MIYGYCRCSTDETKQDIARQERELISLGVEKANIFTEYAHGTDRDRVEFNRLLDLIVSGDTVVATELSRITRPTKDLIDILEVAKDKHIKLVLGSFICDCSADELDPMTEAFLKIAGVFAELELKMTRARIKSGMANAKAKGQRIGRTETTIDSIPDNFFRHYPRLKAKAINKTEFAKITGLSRPSIDKYIRIAEQQSA